MHSQPTGFCAKLQLQVGFDTFTAADFYLKIFYWISCSKSMLSGWYLNSAAAIISRFILYMSGLTMWLEYKWYLLFVQSKLYLVRKQMTGIINQKFFSFPNAEAKRLVASRNATNLSRHLSNDLICNVYLDHIVEPLSIFYCMFIKMSMINRMINGSAKSWAK